MAAEFLSHRNAEPSLAPCSSLCAEVTTVQHPLDMKSDKARKEYKEKLLLCYKNGNVSNLISNTDHPWAWHTVITAHYPSFKRVLVEGGKSE